MICILTTHLLSLYIYIHYLCILKNKQKTLFFKTTKLFVFITYFNAQKLPLQDNVRDNKNAYEKKKKRKREWMRWTKRKTFQTTTTINKREYTDRYKISPDFFKDWSCWTENKEIEAHKRTENCSKRKIFYPYLLSK